MREFLIEPKVSFFGLLIYTIFMRVLDMILDKLLKEKV